MIEKRITTNFGLSLGIFSFVHIRKSSCHKIIIIIVHCYEMFDGANASHRAMNLEDTRRSKWFASTQSPRGRWERVGRGRWHKMRPREKSHTTTMMKSLLIECIARTVLAILSLAFIAKDAQAGKTHLRRHGWGQRKWNNCPKSFSHKFPESRTYTHTHTHTCRYYLSISILGERTSHTHPRCVQSRNSHHIRWRGTVYGRTVRCLRSGDLRLGPRNRDWTYLRHRDRSKALGQHVPSGNVRYRRLRWIRRDREDRTRQRHS